MKRNVVTWVHYFVPVRKVSNEIWATNNSKRPVIAKCMLSAKKVLYAISFSGESVAIQVLVKKGKSVTGKYYKDEVVRKLKKKKQKQKNYQKRCPVTGFTHVRHLHAIAQSHMSAIITIFFLQKEKVTVLPYPLYSLDLAGGGRVVRRCCVAYITGVSNWYWLTFEQGLLSL